jgi:hypothetical protein
VPGREPNYLNVQRVSKLVETLVEEGMFNNSRDATTGTPGRLTAEEQYKRQMESQGTSTAGTQELVETT